MGTVTLDTDRGSTVVHGADTGARTARRIAELTRICERAALGDLEARITGMHGDAEWELLALAINRMLDIADSFVREAAAAMDHCSRDLFHRPILLPGLKGAYAQSAGVINQAGLKMKESSDQVRYIAGLATETATNVTTVAASCEELTSSTSEISAQAASSAELTREAVSVATKASEAVSKLNDAAKKVDNIVTLIRTIATQTNLLALNATIEAARAGAAGKGFAVVASEVKDLSRSTAKATSEISHEVALMQETVLGVGRQMESIEDAIGRINDGADAISRSASQQVQATAEITRSINEVSQNTSLISKRIGNVGGGGKNSAA
jgi:methyl-accepting chemotaxis protein